MKKIILLLVIFLNGCAPASLEEYCFEGEGIIRKIIKECEKIHSKEDLIAYRYKMKKDFLHLTDLMIAAKKFQMKNPEEELQFSFSHGVSNQLKEELMRIYTIEGCRQIMEEMERESLHKLDMFNQKAKFLHVQKKH